MSLVHKPQSDSDEHAHGDRAATVGGSAGLLGLHGLCRRKGLDLD